MANYFNTLPLRLQLEQLGQCEFMDRSEFNEGVDALKGKKIVIIGCGAQGLNQGLNMRDSGLDVSYTLRAEAIAQKRQSFLNASENMELYDIETDTEVYKNGIYLADAVTENTSPESMVDAVHEITKSYIKKNKFVTLFGGEHSISIGSIRAFNECFDNLTVVQIDAHADLRKNYEKIKMLKGNTPKIQFHYYYLRQNGLVKDFLQYYSEYKDEFRVLRNDLHKIAYIMSKAALHIGVDSGFMHLAKIVMPSKKIHIYTSNFAHQFVSTQLQNVLNAGAILNYSRK